MKSDIHHQAMPRIRGTTRKRDAGRHQNNEDDYDQDCDHDNGQQQDQDQDHELGTTISRQHSDAVDPPTKRQKFAGISIAKRDDTGGIDEDIFNHGDALDILLQLEQQQFRSIPRFEDGYEYKYKDLIPIITVEGGEDGVTRSGITEKSEEIEISPFGKKYKYVSECIQRLFTELDVGPIMDMVVRELEEWMRSLHHDQQIATGKDPIANVNERMEEDGDLDIHSAKSKRDSDDFDHGSKLKSMMSSTAAATTSATSTQSLTPKGIIFLAIEQCLANLCVNNNDNQVQFYADLLFHLGLKLALGTSSYPIENDDKDMGMRKAKETETEKETAALVRSLIVAYLHANSKNLGSTETRTRALNYEMLDQVLLFADRKNSPTFIKPIISMMNVCDDPNLAFHLSKILNQMLPLWDKSALNFHFKYKALYPIPQVMELATVTEDDKLGNFLQVYCILTDLDSIHAQDKASWSKLLKALKMYLQLVEDNMKNMSSHPAKAERDVNTMNALTDSHNIRDLAWKANAMAGLAQLPTLDKGMFSLQLQDAQFCTVSLLSIIIALRYISSLRNYPNAKRKVTLDDQSFSELPPLIAEISNLLDKLSKQSEIFKLWTNFLHREHTWVLRKFQWAFDKADFKFNTEILNRSASELEDHARRVCEFPRVDPSAPGAIQYLQRYKLDQLEEPIDDEYNFYPSSFEKLADEILREHESNEGFKSVENSKFRFRTNRAAFADLDPSKMRGATFENKFDLEQLVLKQNQPDDIKEGSTVPMIQQQGSGLEHQDATEMKHEGAGENDNAPKERESPAVPASAAKQDDFVIENGKSQEQS